MAHDVLQLTPADIAKIKARHPGKIKLQVYVHGHVRYIMVEFCVIAKHLSARQLILFCIAFSICVCPSHLGMLIFCTQCVLEVRCAYAAALLWSADYVHKNSR